MNPLNTKPRPIIEVSDSQIKLYHRCPRLWAYKRLLNIDPPEDKYNLIFGSGVHTGLEHLHKGASVQEALDKCRETCAKDAPKDEAMRNQAAALVQGYSRHFFPIFSQNWNTTGSEVWYEYFPAPEVKVRGSRDLQACARINPDHFGLFDFKTSAYNDGGVLGKTIATNVQLSLYSISYCRLTGQWPSEQGLVFLQKPRTKNPQEWVQRAVSDPSLYSMKTEPYTPAMALYAMAVEQGIVTAGKQMHTIARLFDLHGPSALDLCMPIFDNCHAYGNICGFHQGCHACKPIHDVMSGRK